ncbi:MAG TPA: hypothetical protein VKE41_20635, partial [Roseiflexaceae bacterium]|nr:hypothetical protein [Roseiflexaceae bacterium]
MRFLLALGFVLLPALAPRPLLQASTNPAGRIAFVASRTADGNADIFSADMGGQAIVDLTNDPPPDRSPTW